MSSQGGAVKCSIEDCPFSRILCTICKKQICYQKNSLCYDDDGFILLQPHLVLCIGYWGEIVRCCHDCELRFRLKSK